MCNLIWTSVNLNASNKQVFCISWLEKICDLWTNFVIKGFTDRKDSN